MERRDGKRKKVVIYTDGACLGNPGPGGYGCVLTYHAVRKELSGGFRLTTNNRMELMAAIAALLALKEPCEVILHTDSRYLVDAIEKGWAKKWREKGWRRAGGKRAENADLWAKLLDLCDFHEVRFVWVEGHAGEEENERCDFLARRAAQGEKLLVDEGYEKK
ncbi:MAG TPA: ribonuclease HI [Syntrophales bacterium]|nr:ribonuclease HI [Syntrophales bacterium]